MMNRSKTLRSASAVALAAYLLGFTPGQAAKPGNAGGAGGLANPAYVVLDEGNISRLALLSFDGLNEQEIIKAKRFHPMLAPTWSPDGRWIAYVQLENYGRSLRLIHPDGSGEQTVYSFTGADFVDQIQGMQWVPGEVDRIVYSANTTGSLYSISTQEASPTPRLILRNDWWLSGVALSPDLEPAVPGYQGAMAFVGPQTDEFGTLVARNILSVVSIQDGEQGLEVDLSSLVQATTLNEGASTPVWSHDGLEIAFLYHTTTYPDPGNSLEVIPVFIGEMEITLFEDNVRTVYDSSSVDVYGTDHAVINRPSWSLDDSLIGFCATVGIESGGGRSYDLFVANPDGSGAINVTNGMVRPVYMDWNPNWDITRE